MRRLSAGTVWYAYEAFSSFASALAFTVAAVYFVVEIGMSPLELVLVGTVMELAIFFFEVPTGIVADVYSRRLSIVLGTAIMGLGFILVAASGSAVAVLAAYAVWGLGYTFTSGAMDAWLGDEVGDERLARVYLRGAQVGRVAALAGIGASVGLALIDIRLPIAVAGVLTLGEALFYVLAMPERGYRPLPREERGSFAQMAHTGRQGVRLLRARPPLLTILGIVAFAGMWSEGFDRLWEAHFLEIGLPTLGGLDPIVWFGVFGAGATLLAIFVAQPLGKRMEPGDQETIVRVLFWLDATLLVSAVAFGLAGSFWLAVVAYFATRLVRNVAAPIWATWVNRSIDDSNVRATVLSITNQADAIGQWTGGPAIGAVGNVFSIRAALVAAGACMVPALLLYRRAMRHQRREPILTVAQPEAPA
jgi:DHA3 family tetracycline resistance protein-like MFS transporter